MTIGDTEQRNGKLPKSTVLSDIYNGSAICFQELPDKKSIMMLVAFIEFSCSFSLFYHNYLHKRAEGETRY